VLSLLAVGLVLAAVGALVGRWWLPIVAACVWPLFFLGLHAAWWGSGVGDGWAYALVGLILVSVAGAVIGVVGRRTFAPGPFVSRVRGRRVG
jgi:hypothetical protein